MTESWTPHFSTSSQGRGQPSCREIASVAVAPSQCPHDRRHRRVGYASRNDSTIEEIVASPAASRNDRPIEAGVGCVPQGHCERSEAISPAPPRPPLEPGDCHVACGSSQCPYDCGHWEAIPPPFRTAPGDCSGRCRALAMSVNVGYTLVSRTLPALDGETAHFSCFRQGGRLQGIVSRDVCFL